MFRPLVSILIPNYKTAELTMLCLRLLRKYTPPNLARVLVIDNDSQDASLIYLKKLPWIQLIERRRIPNEPPVMAHARALDVGLQQVETPYVLSIHTDTLVQHPQWLPFLITQIEKNSFIAGVGSWKLESKPWIKRALKKGERYWQQGYRYLLGRPNPQNGRYLRSHCALYRADLLKKHELTFADQEQVAGKAMHQRLVALGYTLSFIPSDILGQYLDHINHATTLLNPEFKNTLRRHRDKALRHLEKRLASLGAPAILQATELDF